MNPVPAMSAATAFDVSKVRNDFPILKQTVYGKPLVYLDNAATSQKPQRVIDALVDFYSRYNANIHRGVHTLSQQASEAYDGTREKVQRFIHAASPREIVFVRGTTEAINLVAASFAAPRLRHGGAVVISAMEHHSNIVPWQMLCEITGSELRVIPMDESGTLDLAACGGMLTPDVGLLSVVHTSNSLGTVNPVEAIVAMAKAKGIPVLVDGAQAVAHGEVDVQSMGCDFFVFSGHKMLGPTGAGVLYAREEILETMAPWQGGGDMITSVQFDGSTYQEIPYRFEAGTQNVADVIALGVAIDYWQALDRAAVSAHEDALMKEATARLAGIDGLRLVGTAAEKAGVVSFVVDGVNALDLGMYLDTQGVAVRTGHHCTQPVMDFLRIPGTVRASFLFYNTMEEIDTLVGATRRGIGMLRNK